MGNASACTDVLVCGEALWDIFLKGQPESACTAVEFDGCAGGSPFNVAVGIARLGGAPQLLTGLSTDFLGRRLAAILEKEGVQDTCVIGTDAPTTVSIVGVDNAGQPAYGFCGHGSADRSIRVEDLPARVEARIVHFGSYSLVTPPTADAFAFLAQRESSRCLISLDPNIRLTVEPDRSVWKHRLASIVQHAGVIKVSEEDLAVLYPEDSCEARIRQWLTEGPALVVLTKGSRGAQAWTKTFTVSVQAPESTLVDTVGAGDSFQAALLWGLVRGGYDTRDALQGISRDALKEILALCTCCAGMTVARQGANPPCAQALPPEFSHFLPD